MNNFFKRFLALILVLILAFSTSLGSLSGLAAETKIVYDGLYGNQLVGLEKELYDSLVKTYVTEKKYSEYYYTLDGPIVFDAEIDENNNLISNKSYVEAKSKLTVAFYSAVGAFIYDYPQIFWFKTMSMAPLISATIPYGEIKGEGKIEKILLSPKEIYDNAYSEVDKFNSAVDKAVNEIKKAINGKTDRYSVVLEIHDYVCEKAYYKLTSDYDAHSAEPIFVGDGGVVCEGYAKSFKILCDKFNIPCALVSGTADSNKSENEPHMWNYVKMDNGNWYLVDATWDDDKVIRSDYFLAGWNSDGYYKKIKDERREDSCITATECKEFVFPVLNSESYISEVHSWSSQYTVDVEATCTKEGSTSKHCLHHGCTEKTDITPIKKQSHKVVYKVTTATLKANGKSSGKCSVCGKALSSATIYKPTSFKLSTTSYTYDGKVKQPTVIVKNSAGKTLKKNTDYTVTYASGRKNVGTYKVTIKMKGNYSGTKTLTFKINPVKTTVSKLTAGKKSIKVYVTKKTSQVTGYQIYCSTSKSFSSKVTKKYITSYKTTSTTLSGLSAKKTYYVKVRTYKTVNGIKYYSGWSTYKYTKTK